ncbi:MAG: hypothetical protein LiPW41_73 [Parcubacteria group bacterium LiPW_41]|nr:MAG: hypothetical protein LiPW41_73 [Parcubacteria group bacterium LiPW_41]
METKISLSKLAAMLYGEEELKQSGLTEAGIIEKIGETYKNTSDPAEKKEAERILVGLLEDKRITNKTEILFYLMVCEPIEGHKQIIKDYLRRHNKIAQTIQDLIIERDELPWLTR